MPSDESSFTVLAGKVRHFGLCWLLLKSVSPAQQRLGSPNWRRAYFLHTWRWRLYGGCKPHSQTLQSLFLDLPQYTLTSSCPVCMHSMLVSTYFSFSVNYYLKTLSHCNQNPNSPFTALLKDNHNLHTQGRKFRSWIKETKTVLFTHMNSCIGVVWVCVVRVCGPLQWLGAMCGEIIFKLKLNICFSIKLPFTFLE